jgi:pimeloyl-ACP methyl ester carboxylesterase
MAALMRPDIFKATIQMSHPYHAPPAPQLGDHPPQQPVDIQAELAKLDPPRKHYKWYNSSPGAAHDWNHPPQGLEKYLRGYFHLKSADWEKNDPRPLKEWSAKAIEVMPEYYIMAQEDSFPESVAKQMQGEDYRKTEPWLSPEDLRVYVEEWSRVGFRGALNWYRAQTASTPQSKIDLLLYAGAKITVPCMFISGKQDWGNFQQPGALEAYENPDCVAPGCFRGATLLDRAGHWVQQEQSDAVARECVSFLEKLKDAHSTPEG